MSDTDAAMEASEAPGRSEVYSNSAPDVDNVLTGSIQTAPDILPLEGDVDRPTSPADANMEHVRGADEEADAGHPKATTSRHTLRIDRGADEPVPAKAAISSSEAVEANITLTKEFSSSLALTCFVDTFASVKLRAKWVFLWLTSVLLASAMLDLIGWRLLAVRGTHTDTTGWLMLHHVGPALEGFDEDGWSVRYVIWEHCRRLWCRFWQVI